MQAKQVNRGIRALAWVVALIAGSGLIVLVQNRLMWGYWIERPTIAPSIVGADTVLGVSPVLFDPEVRVSSDRTLLEAARQRCEPATNECLEGTLLVALGAKAQVTVDVPEDLLRQAWSMELTERPLPKSDGSDSRPVHPTAGIGIHFRRGGRDYLALGYRTSEIANDRYIYSEALYRVDRAAPERVRTERFFYEVAGLEAVNWRLLWALNLAGLVVVGALGAQIRARIRRPPASFHETGIERR